MVHRQRFNSESLGVSKNLSYEFPCDANAPGLGTHLLQDPGLVPSVGYWSEIRHKSGHLRFLPTWCQWATRGKSLGQLEVALGFGKKQ